MSPTGWVEKPPTKIGPTARPFDNYETLQHPNCRTLGPKHVLTSLPSPMGPMDFKNR